MLGQILTPAINLLDKVIPDRTARDVNRTQIILADKKVATTESKNSNIFVSGSRPFLRWVLGSVILYQMLIQPICNSFGLQLPGIELNELIALFITTMNLGG